MKEIYCNFGFESYISQINILKTGNRPEPRPWMTI